MQDDTVRTYCIRVAALFASFIFFVADTRCTQAVQGSTALLQCPAGSVIDEVAFASYGNPSGECGAYAEGACHAADTKNVLEDLCVGENSCIISASEALFSDVGCTPSALTLRAQVSCTGEFRILN